MEITPYLSFNGDCEEAFALYARVFGGTVGALFRYGGSPMADQVPADWGDKIMHGSVTVAGITISGADVAADVPAQRFTLAVQISSVDDAERIFTELAAGGSIVVPLAQTFWAARFGQVVDRFGVPWMINCEGAAVPGGSPASAV